MRPPPKAPCAAFVALTLPARLCAQNIHNTIHILVPSQANPEGAGVEGGASATLINPRIGSDAGGAPDDGNENNQTLDQVGLTM